MKKMLVLIAVMLWAGNVLAEVPRTINYQGRITDRNGVPLADTNHALLVRIYDSVAASTPIWNDSFTVPTRNGYYDLVLGSGASKLDLLAFDRQYYLSIQVDADPSEMERRPLNSVPYAFNGVPQGAILMMSGTSCPSGYTRLSAFDGMFPRGAATYGTTGGADTHTHGGATGNGGVDHTHGVNLTSSAPLDDIVNVDRITEGRCGGMYHTHSVSGATQNSSAFLHSHSITSNNNIPRYFNVLFCVKD